MAEGIQGRDFRWTGRTNKITFYGTAFIIRSLQLISFKFTAHAMQSNYEKNTKYTA